MRTHVSRLAAPLAAILASLLVACSGGQIPDTAEGESDPAGPDGAGTGETSGPDGADSDGSSSDGDAPGETAGDVPEPPDPEPPQDSDGGVGTGTGDAPEDPIPGDPARLVPLGFAGMTVEPGTGADGEVRGPGLGAATSDPIGRISNPDHRLRLWLSGGHRPAPEPGVALVGWLTDGFGDPVEAAALSVAVHGYADASLSDDALLFDVDLDVSVRAGRLELSLGADAATILAGAPEAFVAVAIDGEPLSPGVRIGTMPHTVLATEVPAGGILFTQEDRLPWDAVEPTVRVVSGYYRPGEDLRDLPDPERWTCTHQSTVVGYPRTRRVQAEQVCGVRYFAPNGGDGYYIEAEDVARLQVAVAGVGDEAGEVFHAPEVIWPWQLQPACDGDCPLRVQVLRYDVMMRRDCDRDVLVPDWEYPGHIDEPGDPAASGILVHVVSTCVLDAVAESP